MKRFLRPTAIITLSLLIALAGTAVTYTNKISGSNDLTTASLFFQTAPTPTVEVDRSEVGSTDGIVVMGGVIVLIVLVPILVRYKAWMRQD